MSKVRDIMKSIACMINGEVSTKKLIKRGLKVGKDFNRQQGCFIDPTHAWLIEIGNNVTFSIRVTVLAHDASTKKSLDYTKIGRVKIGDNVFVGANTTILPNVKIGNNSVIGANSLVVKDVPENCVVAGNPARTICSLDDFKIKNKNKMTANNTFDEDYTMRGNLTEEKKMEMIEKLKDNIGFIV